MEKVVLTTFGYSQASWTAAKEEAITILRRCARRKMAVHYSQLAHQIKAIQFEPHGAHFAHLLSEISAAEFEAGRGMLTAIVIHKDHDRMPGPSFYECAERLGLDISDKLKLWTEQVMKVQKVWDESGRI